MVHMTRQGEREKILKDLKTFVGFESAIFLIYKKNFISSWDFLIAF